MHTISATIVRFKFFDTDYVTIQYKSGTYEISSWLRYNIYIEIIKIYIDSFVDNLSKLKKNKNGQIITQSLLGSLLKI